MINDEILIKKKYLKNIEILKEYLREFKKISIIDEYKNLNILFNIDNSDYIYKIYIDIENQNIIIELIDEEDDNIIEIFKFNYLSFSYDFNFEENRIKNIFKNYIMNLIDFD